MPAKPPRTPGKPPDTLGKRPANAGNPRKKKKKKATIPPPQPKQKKPTKAVRKMLRQQQRMQNSYGGQNVCTNACGSNAQSNAHLGWNERTASNNWYNDSMDFSRSGLSFEQRQSQQRNQWLIPSYDGRPMPRQQQNYNNSHVTDLSRTHPDRNQYGPALSAPPHNDTTPVGSKHHISVTINSRFHERSRSQNAAPRSVHLGPPDVERPTSPSGGSKLDMSLKNSINNILKGQSSKTTNQERVASANGGDHGEVLLQRAESMCRQFRETRELAKMAQERREGNQNRLERSALDEQIVLYGERARLKARGALPEATQLPVTSLLGEPPLCHWNVGQAHNRRVLLDNSGNWIAPSAAAANSSAFDDSRNQVWPAREPHLTTHRHTLPGESMRVPKKSSETLNRDRISKLVNAPRSRKERLQLEKILQSHKPSGRPSARPKLHVETCTGETTDDVNLSELPGDILAQIEQLIQQEMDSEGDDVIQLDDDEVVPPPDTAQVFNDDLRIEDLSSEPVRVLHTDTASAPVASTNRSLSDVSVTSQCRTVTSQTITTASGNACRPALVGPVGMTENVSTASQCANVGNSNVIATMHSQRSLMCLLDRPATIPVSSAQPKSASRPSSGVCIKTEQKVPDPPHVKLSSKNPSNDVSPVTTERVTASSEHHVTKGSDAGSGLAVSFSSRVGEATYCPTPADESTQTAIDETQGQGDEMQETHAQVELKRRSQISTHVSQEAKRQKVNSATGTATCSTTTPAPSTGDATLARVLVISLRENEIVGKLSDTGAAIERLERLLKETKEQLDRRLTMKQELLEEQNSLRVERLKILSDHNLLATSARQQTAEASAPTRPSFAFPEDMAFTVSAGTTVGGNGEVTQPLSTPSTDSLPCVPYKHEPVRSPELFKTDDTVSCATDSTKHAETSEDCQKLEQTTPRKPRTKSGSLCFSDAEADLVFDSIDATTPGRSISIQPGVCLNYVGTLEGLGMSPHVVMEQLPEHWVASGSESSAVENAEGETHHKNPEPNKSNAANGSKSARRKAKNQRDSSAEKSSDSALSTQGCFKQPAPVNVERSDHHYANTTPVYSTFKRQVNTAKHPRKKVSEVYPGPDANVHKKLKSKKARKPSSVAVRDSSVDTSSDRDGQPDMSLSSASVKQCGKKRPNKRCSDPVSKAVQQYLHAESSSDVEITGLTTAPVRTVAPCGGNDSSVDGASSVDGTSTRQVVDDGIGRALGIAAADFIRLSSSDECCIMKVKPPKRAVTAGCFEGHEGPIRCIYLWKEKHLLTGSEDGTVRQYKLKSRLHRCTMIFSGHTQGVSCIHVSDLGNEGARLFTGSYDGSMLVYSYKTGSQLFAHHYGVQVNTMHADWNKLFLGLGTGYVVKYDFQEYRNGPAMSCAESGITCLASAMEGVRKLLCVASNDCTICVRDAITGLLIHMLEGHTKTPLCLCVVNHIVYSGGTDKSVQVYNLNTAALLKTLRFRAVVTCIAVRDNCLMIASYDGTVRCYDTDTYRLQKIYYGAGKAAVMAMTTTDTVIFTGNREGFCEGVTMNNEYYKCEYGGCDLVFATNQYLHHHVMTEHTNNVTKNAHCQWLNCNAYLKWSKNSEAAIKHTSGHILDK